MKPVEASSVKSVRRALDILERLSDSREPIGFLDLMKDLDIPKSSLFHLMGELLRRGYVEQLMNPPKYRLGRMPRNLVAQTEYATSMPEHVRPALKRLSQMTNETSVFYIREGQAHARGIVVEHGSHALSYRIAPDALVPLHAFSAGKVILASYSETELDDYLRTVPRERLTARTVTSSEALKRDVAAVARSGIGRSCAEFAVGVAGLGMPVRRSGQLIGVLNVSIPEPRFDAVKEEAVISYLKHAVAELEKRLETFETPKASTL